MESEGEEKIIIIKDTSPTSEKPKKEKKPRTEKQKEAAKKMMEALAAKRKQQAEQEEADVRAATELDKQEKMKLQYEVAKNIKKISSKKLPPIPNYVTTAQLEMMERRLMAALPKEVYRDVPREVVVKEKIVPIDRINVVEKETIREKPVIQQKQVSGNELLDKIFFNK